MGDFQRQTDYVSEVVYQNTYSYHHSYHLYHGDRGYCIINLIMGMTFVHVINDNDKTTIQ